MSEVFRHPNQLSPYLLTQIFHRHGVLEKGEVRHIVQRPAPGGSMALNRYLEVAYSPDADNIAPKRLFLKLEPECDTEEALLYKYVFPAIAKMPVPKCFAVESFPNRKGFYLFLEDLSATHRGPTYGPGCIWPTVSDLEVFEQTMDGYAKFHAFAWGDWTVHEREPGKRKIRALPERVQKICDYKDAALGDVVIALCSRAYLDAQDIRSNFNTRLEDLEKWLVFMDNLLSDRQRDLYRRMVIQGTDLLVKRIADGRHLCLIQQDAKPEQSLYPINPKTHRVCITDWGAILLQFGPYDLARHLCRFSFEFRQQTEEHLVRYYHERLLAYGIENYDWHTCWYDYRLGLLKALYPRRMREPFEHWSEHIEWCALNELQAFEDLDCEELFN